MFFTATRPRIGVVAILMASSIWRCILAQSLPAELRLSSGVFNQDGTKLADLPYPLVKGQFEQSSVKSRLTSADANHVRVLVATKTIDTAAALDVVSDHAEVRSDTRVKLVLWTRMPIVDLVTETFVRSAQSFLVRAMSKHLNVAVDSAQTDLDYDGLFLPVGVEQLEMEIFSVPGEEWIKRPFCSRNGALGLLPCPSLILADTILVPGLAKTNMIMPLTTFLGTAPMPVSDVADADRLDYRVDNVWYSYPLMSETRVLIFNKTTLNDLKLKLPPPASDWGTNYFEQWTWSMMLSYVRKIKAAGYDDPFRFSASWDEETKWFASIAQSAGSSVINSQDKCGLQSGGFMDAVADVLVPLWKENLANTDFVPQNSQVLEYRQSDLANPLDAQPTFCCQDRMPWGPGLALGPARYIRNGFRSDFRYVASYNDSSSEMMPAYPPGNSTNLGGQGLSMVSGLLSPSFAWGFVIWTSAPQNPFLQELATIMFTAPPFLSLRSRPEYQTSQWSLVNRVLKQAYPVRWPQPASKTQSWLPDKKPFRMMLMELVYKNVDVKSATDRACTVINSLSLPVCENTMVTMPTGQCNPDRRYQTVKLSAAQLVKENCRVEYSQVSLAGNEVECPYVEARSAVGIALLVTAALCLIVILAHGSYVMAKGHEGSRLVTVMVMAGAAVLCCASAVWMVAPSTVSCASRAWLLTFGVSAFAGTLALYTLMMRRSNGHGSFSVGANPITVFVLLLVLLLVNSTLLLVWMFLGSGGGTEPIHHVIADLSTNFVDVQTPVCSLGSLGVVGALLAVNVLLIAAGFWAGLQNRTLEHLYHDSKSLTTVLGISLTIGTIVAAGLIFLPLGIISEEIRSMLVILSVQAYALLFLVYSVAQKKISSEPNESFASKRPTSTSASPILRLWKKTSSASSKKKLFEPRVEPSPRPLRPVVEQAPQPAPVAASHRSIAPLPLANRSSDDENTFSSQFRFSRVFSIPQAPTRHVQVPESKLDAVILKEPTYVYQQALGPDRSESPENFSFTFLDHYIDKPDDETQQPVRQQRPISRYQPTRPSNLAKSSVISDSSSVVSENVKARPVSSIFSNLDFLAGFATPQAKRTHLNRESYANLPAPVFAQQTNTRGAQQGRGQQVVPSVMYPNAHPSLARNTYMSTRAPRLSQVESDYDSVYSARSSMLEVISDDQLDGEEWSDKMDDEDPSLPRPYRWNWAEKK